MPGGGGEGDCVAVGEVVLYRAEEGELMRFGWNPSNEVEDAPEPTPRYVERGERTRERERDREAMGERRDVEREGRRSISEGNRIRQVGRGWRKKSEVRSLWTLIRKF